MHTCVCVCVCVCNHLQRTSQAQTERRSWNRPTGILSSIRFHLPLLFPSCLSSLVSVFSLWLQQGTAIQEDIISRQH